MASFLQLLLFKFSELEIVPRYFYEFFQGFHSLAVAHQLEIKLVAFQEGERAYFEEGGGGEELLGYFGEGWVDVGRQHGDGG